MTPIVAIIAPGNMGAGVGRRLSENGVSVLTSLAGRSGASERRAREAGMRAVEDHALMEADFLLSIVPPGEALALAKRLAGVLTAANKKPAYVECNAVSPHTMLEIAAVIAPTGAPFVGCRHHRPAAQARLEKHEVLRIRPARRRIWRSSTITA